MMLFKPQLYLCADASVKELKIAIAAFETAGYDTDNVRFGQSWDEFLAQLPDGATVVVHSLDFFPSLIDLLGAMAHLQERGILLKSLQEPWLSEEIDSTADFLVKLRQLAVTLHQNRTKQGIRAAQARGVKVGRPKVSTRRGRG